MIFRASCLAIVCAAGTLSAQAPDTFVFRDGGSRVVSVALTEASGGVGFAWPDSVGTWDTAMLQVNVTVDPGAITPWVEIASGVSSERQYFRAGETGPRWINLSFLRGAIGSGARVAMSGTGVRIGTDTTPLRLFSNELDLSRGMLVLAPHPDDAEIAAFGVYAQRRATIVTVTTGNAGPASYEAVFDDVPAMYQFKGRIRLIDSITVPWQAGIPPGRTFNMGYFDARLAAMHDAPDTVVPEMYGPNTDIGVYRKFNLGTLLPKGARASTWTNLVDDLDRVLKQVKPAVIIAPHPQLDSHVDHQFTTVALAEVLARQRRRVTLLLYTNHADQNRYPYGPAGTIVSLPPPVATPVLLDRLYSHALSPELQRQKLFALESMHDLRPSPSRLYQLTMGDERTRQPEKPGPTGAAGVNYLRRGPRANELFFVYDQDTVKPMMSAFLTAWRTRAVDATKKD